MAQRETLLYAADQEVEMKEISQSKLEALVRDRLEELGSPLPFTIYRRTKNHEGCNWTVTEGPVTSKGPVTTRQDLEVHGNALDRAWEELCKDYNLELEEKESET